MSRHSEPIKLLIPDLPCAEVLLPWLQRIDAVRHYANFGPLVKELESTLAQQWPVKTESAGLMPVQVLALNNGTAPLELAIAAMNLARGAEVLVPALTFPATASAILRNGMQAVFADVATDSWQLTPQTAREVATQRSLALVMPVATFGCPVDVTAWDSFVDDTGIAVLIDAAAAFGNQAIGRRTHASFSMHATKPFGIGEGGLLVSRDLDLLNKVRRLSDFGLSQGQSVVLGTNAKLSEYAAAVGLAQWTRYGALHARRSAMWDFFEERLASLPGVSLQSGFVSGTLPANVVLRLPMAAEKVATALALAGIETRRWYYPTLQEHPVFSTCPIHAPDAGASLVVTVQLAQHCLGMPWHNFLREPDFSRIDSALRSVLNSAQ